MSITNNGTSYPLMGEAVEIEVSLQRQECAHWRLQMGAHSLLFLDDLQSIPQTACKETTASLLARLVMSGRCHAILRSLV